MSSRIIIASSLALITAACSPAVPQPVETGPCESAADCPLPIGACLQPACTNGVCGTAPIAAGTPLNEQERGDCKRRECDGTGKIVLTMDSTDVPDDFDSCTLDSCNGAVPTHTVGECAGCTSDGDCQKPTGLCTSVSCVSGSCITAPTPRGLAASNQIAHDCSTVLCDGDGGTTVVPSVTDVPDDGNPCTEDVCTGTSPSNTFVSVGVSCGGGSICDGAGTCVGCNTATDCPGADTFCSKRACTNHQCTRTNTASGTSLPTQAAGDCRKDVCDGSGNVVNTTDDTDTPNDSNPCTNDVCLNGLPSNPLRTAGSSCGSNLTCSPGGTCQGCTTASDCPGTSTTCRTITCTSGVCGATFASAGTRSGPQTTGDCRVSQCDGTGNVVTANDDADLPVDGKECTADVCNAGVPSNPPKSTGSVCTQNGGARCDATGACVACLTHADCGPSDECTTARCTSGVCSITHAPAGTELSTQVAGNCRRAECDGAGGARQAVDNTDTPNDSNQCTDDVCSAGVPSNPPRAARSSCSQNGGTLCNGAGACVTCVVASDCGLDTECRTRTCTNFTCGSSFADAGTPLAVQSAGDCKKSVCDGVGGATLVNDDADVSSDSNQCTADRCSGGVSSHPPIASGTTCSQSGGTVCNGSGTCVQCVSSAQCSGAACSGGVCQGPTCTDSTQNGTETDRDCGGSCPDCAVGLHCAAGTDCQSGFCSSGTCATAPLTITSLSPADRATNVPLSSTITLTFSQPISSSSVSLQTSTGVCSGSVQVSSNDFTTCVALRNQSFGTPSTTLTFTPSLALGATFKVRVTTSVETTGGASLVGTFTSEGFLTAPGHSGGCGVVISQVYGGGGSSGSVYTNDFIELHNVGTTAIDLSTWSVQYASSTGSSWNKTLLTGSVEPGHFYLVQGQGGSGGQSLPTPDVSGTLALSSSSGKVALVDSQSTLSGSCPTGLQDFVGYGASNCFEGSGAAPTVSSSTAVVRGSASCADTNDNASDFSLSAPSPRARALNVTSCSSCGTANETNASAELDWVALQAMGSFSIDAGTATPSLAARVFESSVTQVSGGASIRAQLGFGPVGVDPRTQCGWLFTEAAFATQVGNDDEYRGSFIAPGRGSYWVTFRFSADSGSTWTYADLDGAGSNSGQTFSTAELPVMTVQ